MPNSLFVILSFLALLILSMVLVVKIFWSLVTPIIFALVMLSIFYPVYRWLLRLCGRRQLLAATLCVSVIFVLVFLPFGFFVSRLSGQAFNYYVQLNSSELFKQLSSGFSIEHPWIRALHDFALGFGINISTQTLVEQTKELIREIGIVFYGALGQIAANSLTILLDTLLTFVILFALFVRGGDLKEYLMQLAPLPHDEQERLIHQFGAISRAVFLGNGVIIILEGIYGGLGFWMFDLGPGTFWGVLIGLAAFIPAIGAWIILIPATLVLLNQSDGSTALMFLLYNAIGFTVFELYIKTKFIGGKSKLHTVLVLLSIIGGVQVYGAFGIFYGPMVLTMCLSLAEIYKEHYRATLLNLRSLTLKSSPNSEPETQG